jgi:hypothetical protein
MKTNNPMFRPEVLKKITGDNNSSKRAEVKAKIQSSKQNKMKAVKETRSGLYFESIREASRYFNCHKQHIMQQLKGNCKQVKGLFFEYI